MADEKDEGCVGQVHMVGPGVCVVHEDDHSNSLNVAFRAREGQPLPPGARLVHMTPEGARVVYDPPEAKKARELARAQLGAEAGDPRSSGGPAMVSSKAFRSGWERTFGGLPN